MGCEQVRDTYEDLVRKSDRSLSRFKHKFDTKNITEVCDVLELYCRLDREYDCKHDSGTEKDAFDAELLKRLLQRYAPAAHHNRLLIAERTHARTIILKPALALPPPRRYCDTDIDRIHCTNSWRSIEQQL